MSHADLNLELDSLRRRVAELESREAEHHLAVKALSSVLETTLDGYWRVDSEARLLDVNEAYCRQSGYTREELLGMRVTDLDAVESAAGTAVHIRHLIEGELSSDQLETRHRRKDGSIWDVEISISHRQAGGGQPFLFLRDISERKRLEEAIRFRQFGLDHAEEEILWIGQDARILDANETACRKLGYTHSEMLQLSVADIDPSYPIENWDRYWQELKRKKTQRLESFLKCRDGSVFPMEVISNYFEYNGIEYACALVRDISGRRQAEEGLQLARQIFDTASEAIFVSDLQGKLLDVNAEACRLAKYAREEMLCLRNVDIVAQEDIPRIAPELSQCDAGQVVENRWLLLCSDGSTVPLDLVVQRLPGDRYLAIGRDLTEREKVYRQLAEARDAAEAASRAKTRFLAAASHDLRQPIQAISLFHEALSKTTLTEEQKRISDYIALSTQSLGGILDELLDVSRLDAGAIKPCPQPVLADTLFRSFETEFAPLAAAKGLRFKLYFPQREMTVFTDAQLVQGLLRNLIGNAIKYTHAGGILVSIRHRGRQAVIQVWDTGIGIAADDLTHIFDEYFQVGNAERNRTKGLGLGLAIVRRLAELMGTKVDCRSRPGRGSVFEFVQPLVDQPSSG